MSIPLAVVSLCPLLLQARASIPLIAARGDIENATGDDRMDAVSVTEGPLFADPTQAPGVRCLGSACAWWEAETELNTFPDDRARQSNGRCAQAPGARWRRDPALGSAS